MRHSPVGARLRLLLSDCEVPMEYFSDREVKEAEQKNQPDPEADELEEFVQMFERLTPEQKSFILSSMKGILSGQ